MKWKEHIIIMLRSSAFRLISFACHFAWHVYILYAHVVVSKLADICYSFCIFVSVTAMSINTRSRNRRKKSTWLSIHHSHEIVLSHSCGGSNNHMWRLYPGMDKLRHNIFQYSSCKKYCFGVELNINSPTTMYGYKRNCGTEIIPKIKSSHSVIIERTFFVSWCLPLVI